MLLFRHKYVCTHTCAIPSLYAEKLICGEVKKLMIFEGKSLDKITEGGNGAGASMCVFIDPLMGI